MRKILGISIVISTVLLFFLGGGVFAEVTGSSPCGTQAQPTQAVSPVSVSVNPVSDASSYNWQVDNGGAVAISPSPFTDLKFTTLGNHSWNVNIIKSDGLNSVSNVCYINVTDLSCNDPNKAVCIKNPLGSATFTDLIGKILDFIFTLSFPVAAVMVMVAGFLFVTGGGDPIKLKKAKDILLWTAIGFGIILVSKGFPFLIKDILGVK